MHTVLPGERGTKEMNCFAKLKCFPSLCFTSKDNKWKCAVFLGALKSFVFVSIQGRWSSEW
jgi:hypothetical protein